MYTKAYFDISVPNNTENKSEICRGRSLRDRVKKKGGKKYK